MSDTTIFLVLFLVFAAPFALYVLAALVLALLPSAKLHPSYAGKHVLITGGSQGLGRALALQLVDAGANVTIVARSVDKLRAVVAEAEKSATPGRGRIAYQSSDTRDAASVQSAVVQAETVFGPIEILLPVAGKAVTAKIDEISLDEHKAAMDLNYFGTLNTVDAVLPGMRARQRGSIVFITSGAALATYVGYAAYSPSKFAVRGLAECLHNELAGSGVSVHIAYPGQMNTPGYAAEMLTKPAECKAIEANDTLHTPEAVAASILRDLQHGAYSMYGGDVLVRLLGAASSGMMPRTNWALDVLLFPLLVLIAWFVRNDWASAVKKGLRS
ncbi:hypothetical protein SPRG_03192 [Saprolegnia parasitica CBS 223.65]|uniref:3-dehydrosphinganine reductase n=1 Tax=Saprolegnia parasitica (strain CBS 223.65) TaxID=695850 RepID=A0A067CZL4_SAPPC|nr:hypothetical protein SPRG_03192 [Saprolegnia parasitica CBS 223.65]KDO31976.1 hypothetical protein SPRG_03192 [Saprolegnia parasitica CBS 223.65]|eukprot:XP_012197172.1 hypothetical protein SPRG_03192 [Saprolegnia parasitica CBS 223.65]